MPERDQDAPSMITIARAEDAHLYSLQMLEMTTPACQTVHDSDDLQQPSGDT